MAASEYLSRKSEGKFDTALTPHLCTPEQREIICTVVLLILPYFLLQHHIISLTATFSGCSVDALLLQFLCLSGSRTVFQRKVPGNGGLEYGCSVDRALSSATCSRVFSGLMCDPSIKTVSSYTSLRGDTAGWYCQWTLIPLEYPLG